MDKITFTVIILFCCILLSAQNSAEEPPLFEQGVAHYYHKFHTGDPAAFKKADSVFTALKNSGNFASPYQRIATDLYLIRIGQQGSPEEDLAHIGELIDSYESQALEDQELYDMLLYYKALLRLYVGQPGAKEDLLKIAEEHLNNAEPNYEIAAMAYDNLSRSSMRKDDYQAAKTAAQYGEKAIEYYDKAGFKAMYVATIQFVGGCYHWMDQAEKSLAYMEKAYGLLKTFDHPNAIRLSQLAFNIALINAGQFANKQKSIDFFKESIHYQIQGRGETDFLVMLYSLLADVYFELKDIEQAEYYAEKGYVLANDVLKLESVYYRCLPSMSYSRIYAAKGDFKNARRVIDKVVEESLDFFGEDNKFTVQAFNDKAHVEMQAKNYKQAQGYLMRAVTAAENTGRVYSKLSAYQKLVELYFESENYDKALEAAKVYYNLNEAALAGDYMSKANAQLMLARGYMGTQFLDSAQVHIKEAKKVLSNEHSNTDVVARLNGLSLETLLHLKKYKANNSELDLDKAYSNVALLIKEIIAGKASFKFNESKLYYSESIVESINTAMEVCSLKYAQGKDPEIINTIFTLMELNKSSVLLDGINDSDIKRLLGVPEQLIDTQNSIKTKLAALNKRLYLLDRKEDHAQEEQIELVNKRLAYNKSIDSITAVLQKDYPKYMEALEFKQTKELSFYQDRTLDNQQALVEYYIHDATIYRITVTKESVDYQVITADDNWEQMVLDLRSQLVRQKDISHLCSELGALLLPDFPSHITDVIFVLDRSLNQIPFEVLRYLDTPLVERYTINYVGSLQLYEKQKELRGRQDFDWVGFAPKYETMNLFDNEKEVFSISQLVEGHPVLGEEATKQALLEHSNQASIIHLATHTELDKLNPMLNKILFSKKEGSNELTTSEIYGLNLQADMAVLSACNTGTGVFRGDGVMSMSRAFTYAGTSSTLMSLWKVPDQQTSELMILFYEYLTQGQSKSEALQNAKLSYLENVQFDELAHPFYWAGFVLSGDDAPINFSPPFWKKPAFIIGASIVLLALLMIVFKRKKGAS